MISYEHLCSLVQAISARKAVSRILVLGLCSGLTACSGIPAIATNEKAVLSRTTEELPDPNAFTLRWFPVSTAKSYRLYIESPTGVLLHQEEVIPQGCTHAAREGYQSGVCSFSYSVPQKSVPEQPAQALVLRLTAVDRQGRESKAAEQKYTTQ